MDTKEFKTIKTGDVVTVHLTFPSPRSFTLKVTKVFKVWKQVEGLIEDVAGDSYANSGDVGGYFRAGAEEITI